MSFSPLASSAVLRSLALVVATLLASESLFASVMPQGRGGIEKRSYFFEEADKDMEYALFVPKSYKKSKASPLVVLLHGLGSNPNQVIRYRGIVSEAQDRGYLVVAPYGYNSRGWYGSRGQGKKGYMFGRAGDPDNLGELSEKDVMNVLEIVRDEFQIDENRIYLMGHSMGGAGTVYLGSKYPEIWAGLAPLAPALDGRLELIDSMKELPVMVVTGDRDRLVPVQNVRRWVNRMKELEMAVEYKEIERGDHVRVIAQNPEMIAEVFDFFDKQARPADKDKKKGGKSKGKQKGSKSKDKADQRREKEKAGKQPQKAGVR